MRKVTQSKSKTPTSTETTAYFEVMDSTSNDQSSNYNAICNAVRCRDLALVSKLLKLDNQLASKLDETRRSLVLLAVENRCSLDIVKALVTAGASPILRCSTERSPLSAAAQKGRLDVIQYLVSHCNADINSKDKYGWTALHKAVRKSRPHCVRWLLEHGANPNAATEKGETAFDIALKFSKSSKHSQDVLQCLGNKKEQQQQQKCIKQEKTTRDLPVPFSPEPAPKRVKGFALAEWLAENDFAKYIKPLEQHGVVNYDVLIGLKQDDLGKIGVGVHGDQIAMMNAIRQLRMSCVKYSASPMKHRGFEKYEAFLTHDWGVDQLGRNNHERVSQINKCLVNRGIRTWFDEERITSNILGEMADGIDDSKVVVVFVTHRYMEKVRCNTNDNCRREFEYAVRRKTTRKILPVVLEPRMLDTSGWRGQLGMDLGSLLYTDLTSDDPAQFEAQIDVLARRIHDTANLKY